MINSFEILKFKIFNDLLLKKYFITNGINYGGDFLIYKDDPIKVHSFSILIILKCNEFNINFLQESIRISNNVNKSLVLCFNNENDELQYLNFNFENLL